MEDVIKLIINYGASAIIVALFLYDWIKNKDKTNKTLEQNTKFLEEMKKTNENTSKSLELLQESMNRQYKVLEIHEERSKKIEKNIETIIERGSFNVR